jgi:hypothetical protein
MGLGETILFQDRDLRVLPSEKQLHPSNLNAAPTRKGSSNGNPPAKKSYQYWNEIFYVRS